MLVSLGPKEQVSVDTSDKTIQIGKIKLIPGTDSYPHPFAHCVHFTKSGALW